MPFKIGLSETGRLFQCRPRFCRSNIARHRYTPNQPSQAARTGCQHSTDTIKLCSDMSSLLSPLLSTHFITELQYHNSVTSLFTVKNKNSGKCTKATLQNLKHFYKGGMTCLMPKPEADSFAYCYILILTTSRLQILHQANLFQE